MTRDEITERFRFAKELTRAAGAVAEGYFHDIGALAVEQKGNQDVVSQADVETEKFIRQRVAEAYPTDAFFGEETGSTNARDEGALWVVDPIDGTQCFVKGLPHWSVSVAFVLDGRIEFGVIYDPNLDELFAGGRGLGATLNGQPIAPDPEADLARDAVTIGFAHRSKPSEVIPVLERLLNAGGMYLRGGSGALSLAYVACGRTIGYYEPHINSWDCYAAVAILREAGADVVEAEAGDGLIKGCEIVATAPRVTSAFNQILRGR
ncbi:MAG: inositol monophosphatase [Alphaproteobacteria bacterium]|nr:inositol monophosphatase [Alphaproteobacteria bacterium]